MAITGPVHPEFEGVPVPIYLPFGIFPLPEGIREFCRRFYRNRKLWIRT
jgi:hypothetical protein